MTNVCTIGNQLFFGFLYVIIYTSSLTSLLGYEVELIECEIPDVMMIELSMAGKVEDSFRLRIDGEVRFRGKAAEKAPENLRRRIEGAAGLVIFHNKNFTSEIGQDLLTQIFALRSKVKKKAYFLDSTASGGSENVTVIYVGIGQEVKLTCYVGSKKFKQSEMLVKDLRNRGVRRVVIVEGVQQKTSKALKGLLDQAKIQLVKGDFRPDFSGIKIEE